ncbi:MAG: hypothetical protein BWK80_11130 [Desulfobacteraceae bacterium IS3]|nr:MAG: hypothetical protein BWK80_11130 [Desulfobacteraceae bacterium IS3]
MKFKYSVSGPSQNEFDSLPRLTLSLRCGSRQTEVVGLLDSGATVSVLPYKVGIQLGEIWDDRKPHIRLGGNLGIFPAIPLMATAKIVNFEPVRLVFAWVRTDVPLILGQTNFFMEFDVCFYRSKLEFEIMPKARDDKQQ